MAFWLASFSSMYIASFSSEPLVTTDLNVYWEEVIRISNTITTLQAVVNPLMTRSSPIHSESFKALSELNAEFVRLQFFFPYPRLGNAQLTPPSSTNYCKHLNGDSYDSSWNLYIECPNPSKSTVISNIEFASYGNPSGVCGNFSIDNLCNANNTMSVVKSLCLNKASCIIPVNDKTFNIKNNCPKSFAIQFKCNGNDSGYKYSNYNFSLMNEIIEDFMNAVNPKKEANKTVMNFAVIPPFMFQNSNYYIMNDNPYNTTWQYDRTGNNTIIIDQTCKSIAEYFGNLAAYYKKGEFTDVYGNKIKSGYNYIMDTWEVLNEPEAPQEHGFTPETYTKCYDQIVKSIQKSTGDNKMKFMGLSLIYHDEWNWYNYFLNKSNHISKDIPIDYISYHFYAIPSNRTDPSTYYQIFPQTDIFIEEVKNITKIRDRLSPKTKMDIDEVGTILPGANQNVPNPPNIYYNAAAAGWSYLVGKLSECCGVDIIGHSQLLGFPPLNSSQWTATPGGIPAQFASVTMLDWNTGKGNAKYWVTKLFIDHLSVGDKIINTSYTEQDSFYAQAYVDNTNNKTIKKILLVNKINDNIQVQMSDYYGIYYYVDETTGYNPYKSKNISGNIINLNPWSVAIYYPAV